MKFPWFKRRPKPKLRPFVESELESPTPTTLEHAVDEGLMIANYSTRMQVKNAITLRAVQGDAPFDPERYTAVARAVLRSLAAESRDDAERLAGERLLAAESEGPAVHIHDYRLADDLNLRRREALAGAMGSALDARADDREYLADLVEKARIDAWDEVSAAIEGALANLSRSRVIDTAYARERDARMEAVRRDVSLLPG